MWRWTGLIPAALLATVALAPAVQAQSGGPISLGDLFVDEDSAILKPGAEAKLYDALKPTAEPAQDGCPRQARFTVVMKSGDELFQTALGRARRDVLQEALPRAFAFVEPEPQLDAPADDVRVDYRRTPDRERPDLHTSSVPDKGSKVGPRQVIKVTMRATDPKQPVSPSSAGLWQTGIQRIQLQALTPSELVDAKDYGRAPDGPCGSRTLTRTLEVTYTVPDRPPPIIRLRAIAEDFAGNHDSDQAEFPTGDWYGAVEFSVTLANGSYRGRYDIALDHDGRGNLRGRMEGTRHWDRQTSPSELWAELVGQLAPDGRKMSLQIVSAQQLPGTFGGSHPWGGGLLWVEPLQQQLGNLAIPDDGVVRSVIDVWGEPWRLTLRRARTDGAAGR